MIPAAQGWGVFTTVLHKLSFSFSLFNLWELLAKVLHFASGTFVHSCWIQDFSCTTVRVCRCLILHFMMHYIFNRKLTWTAHRPLRHKDSGSDLWSHAETWYCPTEISADFPKLPWWQHTVCLSKMFWECSVHFSQRQIETWTYLTTSVHLRCRNLVPDNLVVSAENWCMAFSLIKINVAFLGAATNCVKWHFSKGLQ